MMRFWLILFLVAQSVAAIAGVMVFMIYLKIWKSLF
jgi:hypothetical protein